MLKVKDFKAKGYTCKEMLHEIFVLTKDIADEEGYCYTIRVTLEEDYCVEPEVTFNSSIPSTVFLKVDDITTVDEIEEFFRNMWCSLGKVR